MVVKDKVSEVRVFSESNVALRIAKKQAYRIIMNMAIKSCTDGYYNFKLFHWDIWDNRGEMVMTYAGNYSWEITTDLTAGYNSKFITPWDFKLRSESATELSRSLINIGGDDINNLTEAGNYNGPMQLSK